MANRITAGMKLRCKAGHWEMAEFELRTIAGVPGFEMWVSCEAGGLDGGHWLAPDPHDAQRVIVVAKPYAWPTAVAAFAARDCYREQNGN